MSKKIKPLHQTSTADLRKLAGKEKIPNWETIDRKPLIDALKALQPKKTEDKKDKGAESKKGKPKETKVKKEVKDTSDDEVKDEDKVVAPGVEEERVSVGSKAERMKSKLAKQPKVRVLIQAEEGDKRGSTISVILNGYRLNIQKGVYVDVPEQIADVIMKSQKQTIMALDHSLKIEGVKPELDA